MSKRGVETRYNTYFDIKLLFSHSSLCGNIKLLKETGIDPGQLTVLLHQGLPTHGCVQILQQTTMAD